jgi:hypothetical protein
MTMKTNQKFTVLGMLALGLMLANFNAKAADVPAFQGKFTLTSAIRWGQATLPAGDYTFTLDHNYPGSVVTVRRGTECVERVLTAGISDFKSGKAEIKVESGMVRAVNLPQIGVSLHYSAPNSRHLSPQERQLAMVIPVVATGSGR